MVDVITDSLGRKITLRKLNVLTQMRVLRAIGPAQSTNQPYVQGVFAACQAADVDGVPLPFPTTEAQIDAVFSRLGDEGMSALLVNMSQEIERINSEAEAALAGGSGPLAKPA